MADNTNIHESVDAWADITIKEWVKKANALGVAPGDPLNAERFVHHVITSANGNPEKIQFMYDYWLNFVDWGVGKGVTIEHRDIMISTGVTKRRPKQWFTSVFYVQVKILSQILAEKYALRSANVIVNNSLYNADGTHQESTKHSGGDYNPVDRHTGNKKITKKQFDENRRNAGW